MQRTHIDVTLLEHGIPYAALEKASDTQVIRWFAVITELDKFRSDQQQK